MFILHCVVYVAECSWSNVYYILCVCVYNCILQYQTNVQIVDCRVYVACCISFIFSYMLWRMLYFVYCSLILSSAQIINIVQCGFVHLYMSFVVVCKSYLVYCRLSSVCVYTRSCVCVCLSMCIYVSFYSCRVYSVCCVLSSLD